MIAPAELIGRWETAYTEYTRASGWVRSAPHDRDAAQAMAQTSWQVAESWRALAAVPDLAWWIAAGLHTAANALEVQAHEWHDRVLRPVRPGMSVEKAPDR